MATVMATLARQLVLVLLVTAGGDGSGPRTPVFRGAMALSGRALALFEVQGNAGTWQGEVGRTLPGTTWRIEGIDLAAGRVTIRVGDRAPVTLTPGDTFAQDRVVKAPEPARAAAPLPDGGIGVAGGDAAEVFGPAGGGASAGRASGAGLPGASRNAALEDQLQRQLADPRLRKQLEALGLPLPALFGARSGAAAVGQAAATRGVADLRRASASAPPPPIVSAVPLVRALDASVTVPPISSLGKPGYQTVVMLTSASDPACRALKPRVLSLTRRPLTAVVFVECGERADAPVRAAWNAPGLPHFLLIDPGGGVLGAGDAARRVIDSWLATK